MIYLISSILMLIKSRAKYSIATLMFGLLLLSTICAYMVGRQPIMEFETQIYTLYTALLLCILLYSFCKYSNLQRVDFSNIDIDKLNKLEKITSVIGVIIFVIYIYILSHVFQLLLLEEIKADEYKNEGGAEETFDTMVPHIFITLGNFFSPLGYFFLFLHFYYLIQNKVRKSIFYLLLSFSLILNGLIALSRSATTTYLLCYGSMMYFLLPVIKREIKRRIIIVGIVFGSIIFTGLFVISDSRFSEYYTKNSLNDAILDEKESPMLFSTFDYLGLWEESGPWILKRYHWGDQSWSFYNSNGLGVHLQKMIYGGARVNKERSEKYEKILGERWSNFHGIIARCVFDYGFVGTILFILIISRIIRKYEPKNNTLRVATLLSLPITLPFALGFWAGNALANLAYDLGVIYFFVILYYIKKKKYGYNVSYREG